MRRQVAAAVGALAGTAVFALTALTAAGAAQDYPGQGDPAVSYSVPQSVAVGSLIHVSGTGWKVADGSAGSVVAFKLDDGGVSTTRSITNPVTGAVQGNKTIYGIVQASAGGAWSADLPFPTSDNSSASWAVGETHKITMLTGSLITGDKVRSESAQFTVVAAGSPEAPSWANQALTSADGAIAWVGAAVDAGDVATIRLKGYRWLNTTSSSPSVIAIKLNKSASQQYSRSSGVVLDDPTIWAELSADDTGAHVYPVDGSGNFDVSIPAPTGLAAGQYLTVSVFSGKFGANDVRRSLVSDPLVVGGVAYDPDGGTPRTTCSTTVTTATASATVIKDGVGGTVRLTGAGWCHPGTGQGGSTIGIKVDDGTYSRLDTTVSSNKTVWAIIDANAENGTFSTDIALPDGTTTGARGSDPAFTTGGHSFTLLSGSLKAGDTVRSVKADFVIGAYRPSGIPAPLEYHEDLTAARRGHLTASVGGSKLTVGGLAPGAWTYLSVYGTDGSPRTPWGEKWFRADTRGRVVASLSAGTLPAGRAKIVAQSGARGHVGDLLGWTWITTAVTTTTTTPSHPGTPSPVVLTVPAAATTSTPTTSTPTPASSTPAQAPLTRPAAPTRDDSGLTDANAGQVSSSQDGNVVTVTVADGKPGQWVYVYAYSTPTPVGWIQLDTRRQLRVDVSRLAFGNHKLAVLATDGRLLGWTPVTGTAAAAVAAPSASNTPVPAARTTRTEAEGVSSGWWAGGAALALVVGAGTGAGLSRRTRPRHVEAS